MHFGIFLEERRRGVSESATLREDGLARPGRAQHHDARQPGPRPSHRDGPRGYISE